MPCKSATLPWELEQERNLQYVAYTRAKNKLGFIDESEFKNFTDNTSEALKSIELQVNYVLGKTKENIISGNNYSKHIVNRTKNVIIPIKGTNKVLGEKPINSGITKQTNSLLSKNNRRKKF